MSKCIHCGRKIEDGYTICSVCREKMQERSLKVKIESFAEDNELTLKELKEKLEEMTKERV